MLLWSQLIAVWLSIVRRVYFGVIQLALKLSSLSWRCWSCNLREKAVARWLLRALLSNSNEASSSANFFKRSFCRLRHSSKEAFSSVYRQQSFSRVVKGQQVSSLEEGKKRWVEEWRGRKEGGQESERGERLFRVEALKDSSNSHIIGQMGFMQGALIFVLCATYMAQVFKPSWQAEGVGAQVMRIIGNRYIRSLDPFLMLDLFRVKLPAGFPDHPHRGFETVTYMLAGKFYHEDFKGHSGLIQAGDLQWMTAGRGILHAEMPASHQEEALGFQLWVNLESKNKMIEPAYQEFKSSEIKLIIQQGLKVKIISGKWQGQTGPIFARTPSYYFDVELQPNGRFDLPIPSKWNAIIFVYGGDIIYQGGNQVPFQHCCKLIQDEGAPETVHRFESAKGAKFVFIGGQPLNEPIVQHGPFVMNTQAEIQQTFEDYQTGKNGFQNADKWESKIKQLAHGKKYEEL